MLLQIPLHLLLVLTVILGLGWPVAVRLRLDPAEQIVAAVALSLLAIFFYAWVTYVWALPWFGLWALPLAALLGLGLNARRVAPLLRPGLARDLVVAQLLVTAWCLGWQACVASYSGGGWTADWVEHWERARFFLERSPPDTRFLGAYALTARPPLANVVVAALLFLTRVDFARFQIIATVLASLAFLPAVLLARRFGGGNRTTALLAVGFMLNPLFVQNAAFPWTKLPAAFFVLVALYFFLRTRDDDAPPAAAPLFAASLAAGVIAHYSSAPYALALGAAWLVTKKNPAAPKTRLGSTGAAALAGCLVLALWFTWAFATYGVRGTLAANSSVTAMHGSTDEQLGTTLRNIRDTLVPHFLRPVDSGFIAQTDRWGAWRDWWFQLYQLNLFFAFGSVAWLALLWTLARRAREAKPSQRIFWTAGIASVVLLGIAVHTPRDTWGLTHICLQPLVLLGLAFLAAQWTSLGRGWKIFLLAGAAADLASGIVLHFAVQNHAANAALRHYNENAFMNLAAKLQHHLVLLNDQLGGGLAPMILFSGAVLALAGYRAWREHHDARPVSPS